MVSTSYVLEKPFSRRNSFAEETSYALSIRFLKFPLFQLTGAKAFQFINIGYNFTTLFEKKYV